MQRSEATALTWADVELRDNGSDLLQVHRSKTDPEGEGVVIYIGRAAAEALQAYKTRGPATRPQRTGVRDLLQTDWPEGAGRGDGFTGYSDRVDMAHSGVG